MITDKIDKVTVSGSEKLTGLGAAQIPKYSLIKVRGNMQVNEVSQRK